MIRTQLQPLGTMHVVHDEDESALRPFILVLTNGDEHPFRAATTREAVRVRYLVAWLIGDPSIEIREG